MAVDGWLYHKIALGWLKKTARNPTDRGKQGVKRSLLTDGNGLPLSLAVTGANTHDIKLVADTLYLFTRTGLTASVLPGWDNLSSRCTP
ncbi:hypothetical protein KAM344_41530 [Aeromonas caviae]|nr:hypothetical protein KAM344_41530 [Aeromonas caviae]